MAWSEWTKLGVAYSQKTVNLHLHRRAGQRLSSHKIIPPLFGYSLCGVFETKIVQIVDKFYKCKETKALLITRWDLDTAKDMYTILNFACSGYCTIGHYCHHSYSILQVSLSIFLNFVKIALHTWFWASSVPWTFKFSIYFFIILRNLQCIQWFKRIWCLFQFTMWHASSSALE